MVSFLSHVLVSLLVINVAVLIFNAVYWFSCGGVVCYSSPYGIVPTHKEPLGMLKKENFNKIQ